METLLFLGPPRCSVEELKLSLFKGMGTWREENGNGSPVAVRPPDESSGSHSLWEASKGTALAQGCIYECCPFILDNRKLSILKRRGTEKKHLSVPWSHLPV